MRNLIVHAAVIVGTIALMSGASLADGMAVGPLSNGSLQLFVIHNGLILSAWQTSPGSASWTPLTLFTPGSTVQNLSFDHITTAALPDGRLELIGESSGRIFYTVKVSVNPSAAWSDWTPLGQ